MADIIVAGNTSGAITISAPLVAGSGVLTLPTGTDTLVGKATTDTLTNKTLGAGTVFPAGAVLQVVSASTSTQVSSSSATFIDSGLTATITPTRNTSKILVLVSQSVIRTAASSGTYVNIKAFRNSTDLGYVGFGILYTNTALNMYSSVSANLLDSPATTSATTYKTQFNSASATASVSCQPDNIAVSYITLMEIAG